jgi:hypothetical protein
MIMLLMGMSNGSSVTMTLGGLFTLTAVGMYIGMSVKTGKWNPWKWDNTSNGDSCDAADIKDNRDVSNAATFSVDSDGNCGIATCKDGYFLNGLTCSKTIPTFPNVTCVTIGRTLVLPSTIRLRLTLNHNFKYWER